MEPELSTKDVCTPFQSMHDVWLHYKHVLLTICLSFLHNRVPIKIMLHIKWMIWFSRKESALHLQTLIQICESDAYFNIMAVKSKFLSP